jgi:hypothetical protein
VLISFDVPSSQEAGENRSGCAHIAHPKDVLGIKQIG